jgi:hypothetical protein
MISCVGRHAQHEEIARVSRKLFADAVDDARSASGKVRTGGESHAM